MLIDKYIEEFYLTRGSRHTIEVYKEPSKEWITISEAASKINITRQAIINRYKKGKIPVIWYKKNKNGKKQGNRKTGIYILEEYLYKNIRKGNEGSITHKGVIKRVGNFILDLLKKKEYEDFDIVWEGQNGNYRIDKLFFFIGSNGYNRIEPDFVLRYKDNYFYGEIGGLDAKKIFFEYSNKFLIWIPVDTNFINKSFFIYKNRVDGPQYLGNILKNL